MSEIPKTNGEEELITAADDERDAEDYIGDAFDEEEELLEEDEDGAAG